MDEPLGDHVDSLESGRIRVRAEKIQLKSERIQKTLDEVLEGTLSGADRELAKTYRLTSGRAAARLQDSWRRLQRMWGASCEASGLVTRRIGIQRKEH
jgi:hypothetical protein